MTLELLLSTLRERHVRLWAEGDGLGFEAPAGALDDELIAILKARKPEILAYLDRAASLTDDQEVIPRLTLDGEPQLPSFAQQRLWFVEQLQGGTAAYYICQAWRLRGALDIEALRRGLVTIFERHDVLRSAFHEIEGELFVQVDPAARLDLRVVEIADGAQARREEVGRRMVAEEARRPFDLEQAPLLRAMVIQLGVSDHVLVLSMHHVVTDGWSLGVLLRELGELYAAFVRGEASPLAPLALQYADFAAWQRQRLGGRVGEEQLRYWQAELADIAPLELPTDRARPAEQTFAASSVRVVLPKRLAETADALSRQESATPFMTLLAAFMVLLRRYSGQDDIVVGSPIANRNHLEIEPLIGFFVNTLVMRADLSGSLTFREIVSRVRRSALGAYAHQDLPFERLVAALDPERDPGRNPLFQVSFALQNVDSGELTLPGAEVEPFDRGAITTRFDLELYMTELDDGVVALFVFNTDLFDATRVERMARHYRNLLRGAVGDADVAVDTLPLLNTQERQQLLVEWNDTAIAFPEDVCIHEVLARQAARTPDAVAVSFGTSVLTYAELDTQADRLARVLNDSGIGPDVPVGLCCHRSMEMVVGILGILKAGGAYLPLDPSLPAARLAFMLADTAPPILLLQDEHAPAFPNYPGRVIRLAPTVDAPAIDRIERRLSPVVRSENLAYVLYTSGSTGTPKGVMISHDALCNNMFWALRAYPLASGDRVIQKTPFTFDASVWEFFAPLMAGAELIVAPLEAHRDADLLIESIQSRGATILKLVPSLLRVLVDHPSFGSCVSLRHILCGGEALAMDLADRCETLLQAKVHNLYGPTEATIDVTAWAYQPDQDAPGAPMGRALDNVSIRILNPEGSLVPSGVPGELMLGGVQLARGYLRRPGLTAETFVPDPYGAGRLYRTGDLVRLQAGGDLEFLGRLDHQVKLRGFRIELGEIEAALISNDAVRDAVVLCQQDSLGEMLVAYVARSDADDHVAPAALRVWLDERLPSYMVPSVLVLLDELPLNPSGKIDRRALSALSAERERQVEEYIAPRTETEHEIAEVWREVLEIEGVGVRDNFFDLGGHSLLATRIVARIKSKLQVELSVRTLFEAPTIEGLVDSLPKSHSAAPPIRPRIGTLPEDGRDDQSLALSFSQERLWFLKQLEPNDTAFNLQAAWPWRGRLHVAVLEQSLSDVVRRHEALRTNFPVMDGSPYQHIAPPSARRLPVIDLTGLPAVGRQSEIRRLRSTEASRPFDLAVDPLLRARLLDVSARPGGKEEHLLVLTLHHIVTDYWSMGVLWRELREIYQARAEGRPPALLDLPVQYADYAIWQRQWLQGEQLERGLAYWRERLGAEPPQLDLPFDRPRPTVLSSRGTSFGMIIRGALPDSLRALSQAAGASLYMTLLSALKVLLMRVTGEHDLCVGSPIAGRTHDEVEGLIGFFLNILALRSDLSGEPKFLETVARVRQVALEAFEHQEIPFEKLLKELQPQRDLSHSPLFQVYCNMVHRSHSGGDQAGYWLTPATGTAESTGPGQPLAALIESPTGSARFDLDLHLMEGPGRLDVVLSCKQDLFDAATVRRMLGWYRTLLESVAANPEQPISALPLLAAAERRELEVGHNQIHPPGSGSPFAAEAVEQTVTARFGQQVARAPGQVAIRTLERSWTYAQLDRASNRMARALNSQLGTAGGERVALLFNPGGTFLEGLLGVLKSGHTYVPLDPSYPETRLRFVLADSQTSAIVTESAQAELARALVGDDQSVLLVDQLPELSSEPVASPATPDSLAYILYTSGSTGQPKGVMQNHRNLLGHARAYARSLRIAPEDRLTLLSSYTFDAAAMDVYGALLSGATVCPLPLRDLTIGELLAAMADFGISVYHSTPSVFRYIFSSDGDADRERLPSPLSRIRMVVLGGEETRRGDLELYREYVCPPAGGHRCFDRQCLLVNGLGPTESTLALQFFIDRETRMDRRRVAVGYGVPGTSVELLNRAGAAGEVLGEIALCGDHLALGYWQRPRRTAMAFMPAPDGGRRYRTGDLGRLRADGALEFVGRKDAQVKVRGYRIEPGEVETALIAHPAIHAAVVVAAADRAGENRLAAYVVCGTAVTASDLRPFLRERLPEMMVPSSFTELDALPLTPNGKLDRRALPEPTADREASEQGYVAPSNPIEEQLAAIWQDLLGVERVGVRDDFFDLGGHSLLAMRLLATVGQTFDVELPVRSIFDAPTIAAQEMEITRRLAGSQDEEELARMIAEVEGLTEEELQSLLEAEA